MLQVSGSILRPEKGCLGVTELEPKPPDSRTFQRQQIFFQEESPNREWVLDGEMFHTITWQPELLKEGDETLKYAVDPVHCSETKGNVGKDGGPSRTPGVRHHSPMLQNQSTPHANRALTCNFRLTSITVLRLLHGKRVTSRNNRGRKPLDLDAWLYSFVFSI